MLLGAGESPAATSEDPENRNRMTTVHLAGGGSGSASARPRLSADDAFALERVDLGVAHREHVAEHHPIMLPQQRRRAVRDQRGLRKMRRGPGIQMRAD